MEYITCVPSALSRDNFLFSRRLRFPHISNSIFSRSNPDVAFQIVTCDIRLLLHPVQATHTQSKKTENMRNRLDNLTALQRSVQPGWNYGIVDLTTDSSQHTTPTTRKRRASTSPRPGPPSPPSCSSKRRKANEAGFNSTDSAGKSGRTFRVPFLTGSEVVDESRYNTSNDAMNKYLDPFYSRAHPLIIDLQDRRQNEKPDLFEADERLCYYEPISYQWPYNQRSCWVDSACQPGRTPPISRSTKSDDEIVHPPGHDASDAAVDRYIDFLYKKAQEKHVEKVQIEEGEADLWYSAQNAYGPADDTTNDHAATQSIVDQNQRVGSEGSEVTQTCFYAPEMRAGYDDYFSVFDPE